jgi:LmbE family N-acetylglucosaminyl deacetylase
MLDLLVIVAHPDDESYGVGGTLAEYALTGRRTGLITLTRGGNGRTLGLCDPTELPELRDAELRASVTALGIHDFRQYEYPDAAPPSRATPNQETVPGTFQGGLQDVPLEVLIERTANDLLEMRPRVVISFAPDGSNRHPDHIASHRVTVGALERAGLIGNPTSLYYFASPVLMNPDWADTYHPPTHARDVTPYLVPKLKAIASHRTQALSTVDFLRRMPERIVNEYFRTAVPSSTSGALSSSLE